MFHAYERSVYCVLVGKPEEIRPLSRPGHKWEDNITRDLKLDGKL
jgi:hypothetical protein